MARRPVPVGMDRRQQILSAALDLFAEHGRDGATNEEIAERAGVTPGLIYFYFRSKDDLFLAAFEHQASRAFSSQYSCTSPRARSCETSRLAS